MPVDTSGVTPRARALSAAIRSIRERSGVSGRELSKRLGLSHGTVSHWETGRRVPTPEDVASLLTAAGITGDEKQRVVELARHASEPNWLTVGMPGIPQQLAGAVECERAASSIAEWAPMGLPGLLQTADYARTISKASGLATADVEQRVMLRIARREVLTRRDPVRFLALIGEDALRDRIGEPEVMEEQLRYLLDLGLHDNVTVQVVQPRIGWHPGLAGPFVLYDFPDAPSVVHFEHFSSGAFVPDADDVQAYQCAVDNIRRVALSPAQTTERITEILKELRHEA
ncbi:helix-turn-helix protein [Saccharopolyspora erythraea NRRL 2338]|uniref:Transcriptional regulator, XRE family n=2 Tax=Saccharopolyspora erythraea TaxID=1836 RepID=A4F6H5_SACEN|nr:helix-turn-helix transcriptional regulator [Saccharopolyspora erythraea]EQD85401.1 XRE family transcriptional regulator [Saccharopolyspora erythraea D]PFG93452.1 helix-turn-helix protein [Saccharopolyspora erythraea NRRL 2338]QRK90322.1 helix-turn-helix transcriptional regulator [Saccharopolyspora erythraea]CAL99649.1 transcriptional regulator, XRE family [Saccharopolyspora erythraea NRRL 2338]